MGPKQNLKINWVTTSVLVFYPLLIVSALVWYCNKYDSGWFEWSMAIIAYYIYNISVGIGLHRLWSHSSYKTNKVVEFILMFISSGTLQGPVIAWASDHALHHTYMDEELDPHSPLRYKNKIKGFLWSHIGWMLFEDISKKHIDKGTMKRLGKNKVLVFQMRHYWKFAVFMNLFLPFIIGYCIGGDFKSALAGYIFIGFARALQQQMTFCVNSATHFLGNQPYMNGTPGEIPWMFFLLLGENWHNFHHAFARDYRNGWKWNQIDIHKWIIYLMSKVGLARDLVITPKERVLAKQHETRLELESLIQKNLSVVESGATGIANMAREQLKNIERGAVVLADNLRSRLIHLEESAENLMRDIKSMVHECSFKSQQHIFKIALEELHKLELIANNLGLTRNNALNKI
jgi:stearoyl-CoA desaturase (delta-9 desaturase)